MAVLQAKVVVVVVRLTDVTLVSVIVPVLNEAEGLQRFINSIEPLMGIDFELIFVDGGSTDNTLEMLNEFALTKSSVIVLSGPKGRALQMNAGALIAKGELFLFLHADSYLPATVRHCLSHFFRSQSKWGRFNIRLDNNLWPYFVISWFINHRSKLTGISTGDQAIFVQRDLFESIGGYTDLPLMEDVDLSIRLKENSRPFCINDRVLTSARKWEEGGVVRTVWLMWCLRAAYARGVDTHILAGKYYRRLK